MEENHFSSHEFMDILKDYVGKGEQQVWENRFHYLLTHNRPVSIPDQVKVAESIKFYAKLLKLPTFSDVEEAVRHFHSGQSLESFLLSLMKREYDARQVNQLKHRLHYAGFPLLKTLE